MNAAASALRSLASLQRAGLSLRAALAEWPAQGPPSLQRDLQRIAGRARLGLSPRRAVEGCFAGPADALGIVLAVHSKLGGRLPDMLDHLAATIESDAQARRLARAHAAGVRTSARLVAGLPLLFSPMAITASPGPAEWISIAVGCALTFVGLRWMALLVPSPDRSGAGPRLLALLLSATLAGGANPAAILDECADRLPGATGEQLKDARRRVRLGATWPRALSWSSDPGLQELAGLLGRCGRAGLPVTEAIALFERSTAARAAADLEAALRKAPVKMVVPLTVCVLPAFAILGAAPFLRAFGG